MLNENGIRFDGIYFGDIEGVIAEMKQVYGEAEVNALQRGNRHNINFSVTYVPALNEYQGIKTLQAKIDSFKFD